MSWSINVNEQKATRNALADGEYLRLAGIRSEWHGLVKDLGFRLRHDHQSSFARRDGRASPILHQLGQWIMPAGRYGTVVDGLPGRSYPAGPGIVAGQTEKGFRWH
jgi:hypothetical protein